MELSFCIFLTIVILSLSTNKGRAASESGEEFLLMCSNKNRTSAWTARQANGKETFCETASGVIDLLDKTNIYLVILFIAAGAIVGVSLTLFVVKMKSLTNRSKLSVENRRMASRDTIHYYESVGSLANNFKHRVDQNLMEGHTLLPMDTYINAPFSHQRSLEHRHLYINEQEEEPDTCEMRFVISSTQRQSINSSELDRPVLNAASSINQRDAQATDILFNKLPPVTAVPHRNSHKKICVNGDQGWENDNDGYIIPISPTNSRSSL
ncbi:hypothetical protein BsWGS_09764 [Bradybaena similaris]